MTKLRKSAGGEEVDDGFWRRAEDKAEAGLEPTWLSRRTGRSVFADEPAS